MPAKKEAVKREGEIRIVVETPWKKIILIGVSIIALVAITEILRTYGASLLEKIIPSFADIPPYITNIIYIVAVAVVAIILLLVILRIIKGKRYSGSNADVKRALSIADRLLSKLSNEEIKKFSKTSDAELYEKVLKKYHIE